MLEHRQETPAILPTRRATALMFAAIVRAKFEETTGMTPGAPVRRRHPRSVPVAGDSPVDLLAPASAAAGNVR